MSQIEDKENPTITFIDMTQSSQPKPIHSPQDRLSTTEVLRVELAEREELIQELNAYAHTVAHDLKNPLTVIAGYSDLLLSDAQLSDEAREWVVQIRRMNQKMRQIVDSLLMLASVRRDDIQATPTSMIPIIQEAQSRFNYLIQESGAQIHIQPPLPPVMGHSDWLEEVWANYLSNALKYGGTPPIIEIGANILADERVRYWIRDYGDGLSPEEQHQVFKTFKQFGRMKPDSHGLGLSIVQRIIEKLGGMVFVESTGKQGEGCTFGFILPAAPLNPFFDADEFE